MLERLSITNFVLIEKLELEFGRGLNLLTGETGAGKSILIDAISAILGEKMSTDKIRTGFDRAVIEAEFTFENTEIIRPMLDEAGVDFADNTLIIRRELFASGKGRCFVNGMQLPAVKIAEFSDYLLAIHGQNEHITMAKSSTHRELLDNYADNAKRVEEVGRLYKVLSELKERIRSTEMDEREKARRIEYLQFAVDEIDKAKLSPSEEEALKEESNILANAEKIYDAVFRSSQMLKEDAGVLVLLKKIEQSLSHVSDFDAALSSELDRVREAMYQLEDTSSTLRSYVQSIDFSPERLNEIEERLAMIFQLKKKYGATIQEVIRFCETSRTELDSITNSEEAREKLLAEYKARVAETKKAAFELSQIRIKKSAELESRVMEELADLNMKGTLFSVQISQEISESGVIEDKERKIMLYPHGIDRIEFMLAANKGEKLTELRKAASGGEMSRIMLAIKKVLLSKDIVESLVFDEVDSGISGKTAEMVGKKLKSLAAQRQVFVITHLPQIAAMADRHYCVKKDTLSDRTFTTVELLPRDKQILEVARLLAGEKITDLTLRHAQEMIEG